MHTASIRKKTSLHNILNLFEYLHLCACVRARECVCLFVCVFVLFESRHHDLGIPFFNRITFKHTNTTRDLSSRLKGAIFAHFQHLHLQILTHFSLCNKNNASEHFFCHCLKKNREYMDVHEILCICPYSPTPPPLPTPRETSTPCLTSHRILDPPIHGSQCVTGLPRNEKIYPFIKFDCLIKIFCLDFFQC